MESIAISLGWDCDAAIIGVERGFRKTRENGYHTCPFDLMLSNYPGVIDCLYNNFKGFTDPNNLKFLSVPECALRNSGERIIINTKYRFMFNHESPEHAGLYDKEGWEGGKMHFVADNFENFIKRYQRRIENFQNYINSGNKIVFLLNRPQRDFSELIKCLDTVYPNLDYEIRNVYRLRKSNPIMFFEVHQQMGFSMEDKEIVSARKALGSFAKDYPLTKYKSELIDTYTDVAKDT